MSSLASRGNRWQCRQVVYGVAAGAIATGLAGAPGAYAATPPQAALSAENCDPIIIPQPAAKKPVKKAPAVRKAAAKPAQSKPAKPLPKPVEIKAEGTEVAQAKPKPRPRPKPKPKAVAVAAKPMVISDACPGAGSNPEDVAGLPTNLKDLMTAEPTPEALASIFPAAGGQAPLSNSLTDLAPAAGRSSGPGNFGPTVPMMPGGGSIGGGGNGSNGTTPVDPPGDNTPPDGDTPPDGNTPPDDNTPPDGDTPPSEIPPPPVQVPEPGTLGVLLGGLAAMVAFGRRRRRS